jgi:hypothetical protein
MVCLFETSHLTDKEAKDRQVRDEHDVVVAIGVDTIEEMLRKLNRCPLAEVDEDEAVRQAEVSTGLRSSQEVGEQGCICVQV